MNNQPKSATLASTVVVTGIPKGYDSTLDPHSDQPQDVHRLRCQHCGDITPNEELSSSWGWLLWTVAHRNQCSGLQPNSNSGLAAE